MRIGFIGVGNMGAPMALRLINRGDEVTVLDPNEANVSRMVAAGASRAASPGALASGAQAIITMLPSGREVRSVYLGAEGIVAAAGRGVLLIDCSTADVAAAREAAVAAKARGQDFLDAPVSGGVAGAEAGTLTFMVGGEAPAVERARGILEAMGKTLVHVGTAGAGQAAKVCNNLILGISMIGVCEAFVLAEHLGLGPDKLFAVSANSSGQCWSLTSYCPVPGLVPTAPSNRDFAPGFSARMMLKDLRLAVEAARRSGCQVTLGQEAMELYERLVQEGSGHMDFSCIINSLRQK